MILLLTSLALGVPPADDDAAAQAFAAALVRMREVSAGIRDATYTLHTQEYVDGGLTAPGVIHVAFRGQQDVFLRFGAPYEGRKVLFRGSGWNDGKLRVDPGRFLPTLNLDPRGRLAMRGNRHWIGEVPLTKLVERIVTDSLKVNDHPVWIPSIADLGERTVQGQASRCFDTRLPKEEDATLYARQVEVCIARKSGLPSSMRVFDYEDGAVRLVESYDYSDLVINPGLTDADFMPETHGL